MTTLTTSKIQFRRALYLMTRYFQHGAKVNDLDPYQIDSGVWQGLLDHHLIERHDQRYLLTDTGLQQAQTIFPSAIDHLKDLSHLQTNSVDGFVFISDLDMYGNDVDLKYLVDEKGNVTEDINDALVCDASNWRLKKKLMRSFGVEPLFRSMQVVDHQDDDDTTSQTDYSDWLD